MSYPTSKVSLLLSFIHFFFYEFMVIRYIYVRTHGTVIGSREFELFTCSGLFCGLFCVAVGLRVLLLFCGVLEEEGGL